MPGVGRDDVAFERIAGAVPVCSDHSSLSTVLDQNPRPAVAPCHGSGCV